MAMASTDQSKRIWKPVREQAADSCWVVLIVSVSTTVLITRVFLELTGYPQVGDTTYHVAHVLWGGLLLFIAVALRLSWINWWTLWVSAVLGGIGAGLFIDEVGKFITQSNDYFFPLAFPIIYAFILICVWLYWRIRRYEPRDTRTLLYHALEDMKQVLDNDLDPFEHRELVTELKLVIAEAKDSSELKLAEALLSYAQSREVRLAVQPNILERALVELRSLLANQPPRLFLRIVLILGFGILGAQALVKLVTLATLTQQETPLSDALSTFVVVSGKSQYTVNNPTLLLLTTVSVIGIGVLASIAAGLLLVRRERLGLRIGTLGLIVALSIVNLFTFYFSQLLALADAAGQLLLLIVAGLYRWRFLNPNSPTVARVESPPASHGDVPPKGEIRTNP